MCRMSFSSGSSDPWNPSQSGSDRLFVAWTALTIAEHCYWHADERVKRRPKRRRGNGRLNAVEIEEAVSKLVEQPYDAAEFSYAFLEAFGNKAATIKRLRSTGKNTTNKSDLTGDEVVAVLQRNNIHIATCAASG